MFNYALPLFRFGSAALTVLALGFFVFAVQLKPVSADPTSISEVTPVPTDSSTPTPVPTDSSTNTPTASPVDSTLPDTGIDPTLEMVLASVALIGISAYQIRQQKQKAS